MWSRPLTHIAINREFSYFPYLGGCPPLGDKYTRYEICQFEVMLPITVTNGMYVHTQVLRFVLKGTGVMKVVMAQR